MILPRDRCKVLQVARHVRRHHFLEARRANGSPDEKSPRCASAPLLRPTRMVWIAVLPKVSTMKSCVSAGLSSAAR